MKKSLIALAVLAASGASFAQVTVTGNLTYGYQSTTTATNNGAATSEQAGLGADTTNDNLTFKAKEDLGGGYAATASLGLKTGAGNGAAAGNGGGATSGDTTLTLATPVGGLVLGNVKAAEYLSGGLAGVDAYYAGWDGKVLTPRTYRDFWAFVVPVGAFTFAVGQQEPSNTNTLGAGYTGAGNGSNLGTLLSGTALTNLSVTYAAGPLNANAQYLAYKNSGVDNAGFGGKNKDTTRVSANYDLGMAKLGAGYQVSNVTGSAGQANPKVTDWLVGAKIPMGASSFGITYTSRTWDDINATATTLGQGAAFANASGTGYSLEYGYAMSKRTSIIANYARWTQVASGVLPNPDASNQYQLLLSHSF